MRGLGGNCRSATGEDAGGPAAADGLRWLVAVRQSMPLVLSLVPVAVMLGGVLREEADIEVRGNGALFLYMHGCIM